MHTIIRLSPSWPQRLHARIEQWIDGLWSLFDERITKVARSVDTKVELLPSWCWPLLVALAAWPSAGWAVRRLLDDSDDPLGIVALGALMLALWHARGRFARAPRLGMMAVAAALVVVANVPSTVLPDLVRALMASIAIVFALAAIAEPDEPIAPYAGLAILALPLLSSLQFYAGFPLRVVTAEASRWLLTAVGSQVERVGTALTVDGHLVLVDAPCSGVQMAWVGYCTACIAAWMFRVANRAFVARLPFVSATVLVGNIVRNTVLVAADADGVVMTDAMHAAIGLAAFAVVGTIIAAVYAAARRPKSEQPARRNRSGTAHGTSKILVATLLVAATLPFATPVKSAREVRRAVEWPTEFEGRPLRPLALSPVELRFAARFPGTVARFEADDRTVVLRDVTQPTRRLHPAVDCYRGSGYAIAAEHLERDAEQRFWRCFTATRDGRGLRVCERIVDADGQAFTDVSSWFWAASLARSRGPWRALTVATPIDGVAL
jgi:exosortase/archaeosortase family protein